MRYASKATPPPQPCLRLPPSTQAIVPSPPAESTVLPASVSPLAPLTVVELLANRLLESHLALLTKYMRGSFWQIPTREALPGTHCLSFADGERFTGGAIGPRGCRHFAGRPRGMETAEKRALDGAVLTAIAGAPDDVAKAQDLLKAGTLTGPRAAIVTVMASTLFGPIETLRLPPS